MLLVEVNYIKIKKSIIPLSQMIYRNFIHLENQPNVTHNLREIQQLLVSETFYGILLLSGKLIYGYLVGEIKKLNDGRIAFYLWYIYVNQKYRHQKFGAQMMDKMINKCKMVGITFIVLSCDMDDGKLINFYKKYGFIKDPILNKGNNYDVMCLYL